MPTPQEIQDQIDNIAANTEPIDLVLLALDVREANTGISISVPTKEDLPDLSVCNVGEGRMIYVENIGLPVMSTCGSWRGLDGKLLRRDFPIRYIFTWGAGVCGMLGDGTTVNKCSPVREMSCAADWCQVSAGQCHTAAVKTSGQLWTWGGGSCGRLGDGTTVNTCSPVREICSATDWRQVSVGQYHMAAVKTSGQIWSWGSAAFGNLGDGTVTSKCSPVRERCSATDWCQVSAGQYHTAAIKTSGQLWIWGIAGWGNLGDGTTVNKCSPVRERCSATDWCQVSASRYNTAAVKTSGQLWIWGEGSSARLGDGTTVSKCSPVREICSATDWCQVCASRFHTAAVKTSGQIWSWGYGGTGALGDGTTVNKCSPVREISSATNWCQLSTGRINTTAVKTSGQIWSWGRNSCGQLGDGTVTSKCSPVREISFDTNWCVVSSNETHAIAIKIR